MTEIKQAPPVGDVPPAAPPADAPAPPPPADPAAPPPENPAAQGADNITAPPPSEAPDPEPPPLPAPSRPSEPEPVATDYGAVDPALAPLVEDIASTPSGRQLLEDLRAPGAQGEPGGLPEMVVTDIVPPGDDPAQGRRVNPGKYDPDTNVMTIDRTMLERNPEITTAVLAHELYHTLDDRLGLLEGLEPGEPGPVANAVEARAYSFTSHIVAELGIDPKRVPGPITTDLSSPAATYQAVWDAMNVKGDPPPSYLPGATPEDPF